MLGQLPEQILTSLCPIKCRPVDFQNIFFDCQRLPPSSPSILDPLLSVELPASQLQPAPQAEAFKDSRPLFGDSTQQEEAGARLVHNTQFPFGSRPLLIKIYPKSCSTRKAFADAVL